MISKNYKAMLLLMLFFFILPDIVPNGRPSAFAENLVHTVIKGDTIFSLSRTYGLSQDELMQQNGLKNASELLIGMRLIIPEKTSSTSGTSSSFEYTVKPNDTLYSLARLYNVSLQALSDANKFPKGYMLKAGEKIIIPASNPAGKNTGGTGTGNGITAQPPKTIQKPVDPSVRWPVSAKQILYLSSNLGVLVTGEHSTSIKSLSKGTVVHASPWRGYGNVTIVERDGGYKYIYGSCETLSVKKGDSIEAGTELGKLGIFAASGKPDLVFIVLKDNVPIDPAKAPRF